jgi:hypothetical protein
LIVYCRRSSILFTGGVHWIYVWDGPRRMGSELADMVECRNVKRYSCFYRVWGGLDVGV